MTEEKKELVPWVATIGLAEKKFEEITRETGTDVSFATESMFALQVLSKNEYSQKVAMGNLNSLRDSIINIASIGLSLNPAMQYAYLVPRDGAICLDVSYKGLIKLATDTGSMLWVRAELVYKGDTFRYRGPAMAPDHEADVFGERGEFVGVYCIAKTLEGDILAEVMPAEEIYKVRDTSQAWKKSKSGPWKDWFGEMTRKTIIKRASKTWPRSDKNDRLAKAVEVINQHEGFPPIIEEAVRLISEEQCLELTAFMEENSINKERFLKYANVERVEQITPADFPRCLAALKAMVAA